MGWSRQRLSLLSRYFIAALVTTAVLAARMALAPVLQDRFPYLLFIFAVIANTFVGGEGPGVLTGVAAVVLGHFFFVRPYGTPLGRDGAAIALFLLFTAAVNWLAYRLRDTRRRAEEGEKRIVEVLESITDHFVALDKEWRFVYINGPAEAVLGRPRQDLLGKNIWHEYPRLNGSRVGNLYREVYRTRSPRHREHYYRPTQTWFELNVYPSKEGGISIYFLDITERKRNEAEAARLAALVESCDDAIISAALDGTIQSWNSSAERLFGYTAAEAIGQSIYMLLPPGREDEEKGLLAKMERGERVEHYETVRVRKDGSQVRISLSISPIRGPGEAIIGVSGIARDVTARVELEEKVREAQKLESLGVLAGGVAHDFNNLLVAIMGNAGLALERLPADDSTRHLLQEVVEASQRAATLTRQLLAYAGRGRFVMERVDLSQVVREAADRLRASTPKNIALQLRLAPDLPRVEADAVQMQQMVINLLINAAEAIGDAEGWVRVATSVETIGEEFPPAAVRAEQSSRGEYVRLIVQDNGCGMDEETRTRIFDPFFTTKFTGRGLGLAAVSGIVRSHGGMLEVSSRAGEGTTMQVWLPAAVAEQRPAVMGERGESTGRGTILVIDNEDAVRRAAKAALERYGYAVELAENGHQAVHLLNERPGRVALAILDMAAPGLGGQETFRRLRAIQPDLRVVVSSDFNETEAARRFAEQEIAGYLQKPYTASQLAEKVRDAGLPGR